MDKQVFAAIDNVESYSEKGGIPDVIRDNTVLRLMKVEELFGWAWSIKTEEEKSAEGVNKECDKLPQWPRWLLGASNAFCMQVRK